MDEYTLKSKAASYSGTEHGTKEFIYPLKRKDIIIALQEALIELAKVNKPKLTK